MTPEGIALLVASFLGSTGIASFISSGAKFTRAARLRGAISASKKSLEGLDPSSSAYRATQVSITVMTLEAASYALVRVPMRMRSILIIAALAFGLSIVFLVFMIPTLSILFPEDNINYFSDKSADVRTWHFILTTIIISIGYIIFLSTLLSLQTSKRREHFVADVLRRDTVDYDLLVKHGSQLRSIEKYLKDKNTELPAPDFSKTQHYPEIVPEPERKKMQIETRKQPWWKFRASRHTGDSEISKK